MITESLDAQVATLEALVNEHWGWQIKPFQLEAITAQLYGKDVVVHAATGSGKTCIAAGPHLLPCSAGKVTLLISPLLQLHDEQVITFQKKFQLSAIAINSKHQGLLQESFKEIVCGRYQIVILSPEMLQTRRFTDSVLRRKEFTSRCLSVVVDEAHCVSHWGDSFRKKYATVGNVRAFLNHATPIVALSATLTPRVFCDLIAKLQFHRNDFTYINMGNDRPNVSIIVIPIEWAINSYNDLDFVVPQQVTAGADVPKTFIYIDDTKMGAAVADHLNGLFPEPLQSRGLVRPFNASMSQEYCELAMDLFRQGIICILICTDAAGMGCDIPDVDVVVQWRLPDTLSAWVQRSGRAARSPGRRGLAVLLFEKSAMKESSAAPKKMGRPKGARGIRVNILPSTQEAGMEPEQESLNTHLDEAPREGLYHLLQTTQCRRQLFTAVFQNPHVEVDKEVCCDVCNPLLKAMTIGRVISKQTRRTRTIKANTSRFILQQLLLWREEMKSRFFPDHSFLAESLLDDVLCETIASWSSLPSLPILMDRLQSRWGFWDVLGDHLNEMLRNMEQDIILLKDIDFDQVATEDRQSSTLLQDAGRETRLSAFPDAATAFLDHALVSSYGQDSVQELLLPPILVPSQPHEQFPSVWQVDKLDHY